MSSLTSIINSEYISSSIIIWTVSLRNLLSKPFYKLAYANSISNIKILPKPLIHRSALNRKFIPSFIGFTKISFRNKFHRNQLPHFTVTSILSDLNITPSLNTCQFIYKIRLIIFHYLKFAFLSESIVFHTH